jgi:hypothetical protein
MESSGHVTLFRAIHAGADDVLLHNYHLRSRRMGERIGHVQTAVGRIAKMADAVREGASGQGVLCQAGGQVQERDVSG